MWRAGDCSWGERDHVGPELMRGRLLLLLLLLLLYLLLLLLPPLRACLLPVLLLHRHRNLHLLRMHQ